MILVVNSLLNAQLKVAFPYAGHIYFILFVFQPLLQQLSEVGHNLYTKQGREHI